MSIKENQSGKQMSESMILAVLLTLAGGFQDAYSYNCRGKVFANAQTGNIVLLGQNLAQGDFTKAFHYLMPIVAFLAGVYVTEWIHQLLGGSRRIHWRQIVVAVEGILLIAAGALPESLDMCANVLLSFACAMQVNSFRKFAGISCATTMCIGNMRSATEMLCMYHVTKEKRFKKKYHFYYGIILTFALGAVLGTGMSGAAGDKAIWMAAAFLLLGFILMFIRED